VVPELAEPVRGLDLDGGLGVLTKSFAEQVGAETAVLVVREGRGSVARARATWGLSAGTNGLTVRSGVGAVGRLLHGGPPTAQPLEDPDTDPIGDAGSGVRVVTALGAPVRAPGGDVGALCAGLARPPWADRAALLWTAKSYAAAAALCLEGSGLLGALTEAARRDQLTGCLNYDALEEAVDHEIGRCERHGRNLACCFIDLDRFKPVNDTRGHQVGNRALMAAAAALRHGVRGSDLVGRYGGDEFVVVLPETDKAVALELVLRLRTEIERATQSAIGEPIGASVGVGEWTPGCSTGDLLDRANQGLRIAKDAGGGAIVAPAVLETPGRGESHHRPHPLLAIRRLHARRRGPGGAG
jgi:diguanylate cyclase (GGDEF)-like protein